MSFDRDGLAAALAEHGCVVRVVVAEVQGSAPREVGAAMLVWARGQTGTIGGGALEHDATAIAREMLATGPPRQLTRAILGPDLGQCCGGAVALVYERFERLPPGGARYARPVEDGAAPRAPTGLGLAEGWFVEPLTRPGAPVVIWGAGHVGRALAHVLAPLPDVAVTLADIAPDRFPDPLPPGTACRLAPDPAAAVAESPETAHHLIVTHSHARDLALCDALLTRGFASAGLIGSATKWARFRTRLAQRGHRRAQIARIRCPIGTPALGKHPAAIAVGVAHALLIELAQPGVSPPRHDGDGPGTGDDRRASDA